MTEHVATDTRQATDALGVALMRATGVLSALTACQDLSRGTFALEGPFLSQAISAVEGFVNDARNAYFDLLNANALGAAEDKTENRKPTEPKKSEFFEFHEEQVLFVTEEQSAQSALPDIYALRTSSASAPASSSVTAETSFATSYDDLMRKLTAAEVFASERGIFGSDTNSPLLPLLRSLREDLNRFRAA